MSTQDTNATAARFDHHDDALRGEALYETYANLQQCPVARSEQHGGFWVLTRAAEVEEAARDWRTFSSADGVFLPERAGGFKSVALEQDPPEHSPFRKLYAELLSRGRVKLAEPRIRAIATRCVDDLHAAGGGDFVDEVAAKLPVETVAHMLGMSDENAASIREQTESAWRSLDEDPASGMPMAVMLMQEVQARRADPADDFLTVLVGAEVDGRTITDEEIVNFLMGAVIAGHETTLNASANLAYELGRDPALQARLREQPELIPHAVEESLRHRSPVQSFLRTATQDTELHGCSIRAGDRVMLLYGAANRDPERYADPARFDLDRRLTKHFGFGWGVHRCVGSHLAQTELRILLETLLEHPFELTDEPTFGAASGGGAFLGIEHLRMGFAS